MPESTGGSSRTSPFTAMPESGNTYPVYPSGVSIPKPRGTFAISPDCKVQLYSIKTSAPHLLKELPKLIHTNGNIEESKLGFDAYAKKDIHLNKR